jgi:hypothetical protein
LVSLISTTARHEQIGLSVEATGDVCHGHGPQLRGGEFYGEGYAIQPCSDCCYLTSLIVVEPIQSNLSTLNEQQI